MECELYSSVQKWTCFAERNLGKFSNIEVDGCTICSLSFFWNALYHILTMIVP